MRKGFTVVEFLIVLAFIGLSLTIFIPVFEKKFGNKNSQFNKAMFNNTELEVTNEQITKRDNFQKLDEKYCESKYVEYYLATYQIGSNKCLVGICNGNIAVTKLE